MTQSRRKRMDAHEFGVIVRRARQDAGLKLSEASRALAVSARQIQKYEAGHLMVPVDIIARMAKAYGDPWIRNTYCQCVCAIDACPRIRIGIDVMSSLLDADMYDSRRLRDAARVLYTIAKGGIEPGNREDYERSVREVDGRAAQLFELAASARAAQAEAERK